MTDLLILWHVALELQRRNDELAALVKAANACSMVFSLLSKEVIADNDKLREQLEATHATDS